VWRCGPTRAYAPPVIAQSRALISGSFAASPTLARTVLHRRSVDRGSPGHANRTAQGQPEARRCQRSERGSLAAAATWRQLPRISPPRRSDRACSFLLFTNAPRHRVSTHRPRRNGPVGRHDERLPSSPLVGRPPREPIDHRSERSTHQSARQHPDSPPALSAAEWSRLLGQRPPSGAWPPA
jgi:hypothetical protein